MWLFGYGSLIWKAGFPWEERRPVYVRGWTRRFYQGSTDHRGVPGAPGRVVTLLPEWSARCVGVAYRIGPDMQAEVLAALDHREQGGYGREVLPIHDLKSVRPFAEALVYRALPGNACWLGAASVPEMAAQIAVAAGPSGPNREYLEALHWALNEMSEQDAHVRSLMQALP